jgi:hypothetical protein
MMFGLKQEQKNKELERERKVNQQMKEKDAKIESLQQELDRLKSSFKGSKRYY